MNPGRKFARSRNALTWSRYRAPVSPVCVGLAATLGALSAQAQQAVSSGGIPSAALLERPGLHLGRFEFHGGVQAIVAYDDLVQITTNGPQSDVTWNLAPFISAETRGPNDRTLAVSYRPNFLFFTDNSDLNTVNHNGTFNLRFPLNRLTLSLAETVAMSSTVVRDIGNRATQTSYSTIGTADYDLSDRTSLQGNLTYDRFDYESEVRGTPQLTGSQQLGQQIWADYHWTSRLFTGMGVRVSELDVYDGVDQISEGPEWRVNYSVTSQLSLMTVLGVQFRQYESGRSSTMEPELRLNALYTPRPGTSLSVEGHRAELASGINSGQNYVDTGFNVTFSQVFLRNFVASIGGGYTMADYRATVEGVSAARTDSYYSLRTSLNWNVKDLVGLGLFFEHTANDSNTQTFNYDHNIVGLQATWSF